MNQRGFSLLAYGLLALAILGALSGLAWKIRESGKDAVRLEWAEANRKAEEAAEARRAASDLIAKTSAGELAAAQKKGRDYEARWRRDRAKVRDSALAACEKAPPRDATEVQATPLPDSGSGPVRFSWGFVGLWDAAWRDQAGEPLYPYRPAAEGPSPDTPSPVGPGEVLDTHGENAARCSTDRRALDSLIDQIEHLRDGWK